MTRIRASRLLWQYDVIKRNVGIMEKCIIVAVADNNAIGRSNDMPWHISEDLKYFKKTTLGCPVIMGRRTFESLGRPLPKRTNIVVTRSGGMTGPDGTVVPFPDGVLVARSLEEAFMMAAMPDIEGPCFVIGGGEIYKQAIKSADRLYVTEVHVSIEDADTFFPAIDPEIWKVSSRSETKADPATGYTFEFVVYHRK